MNIILRLQKKLKPENKTIAMQEFITQIHFQNPEYLYLLLLIPVYVFFLVYTRKKGGVGFYVSVFDDLLKSNKWTLGYILEIVRIILVVCIFLLFVITLARPQVLHTTRHITKTGIDIVMALDVSESMLAEDLKPNRIEAAKNALRKFIATRKSDRVGIVIFAGAPFTQSPLTFDYNVLDYYLKNISTNSIDQSSYGASGTAIGDAILAAVNRLRNANNNEDKDDAENKRSKIIVLLSDGDANVGIDPKIAAYKAKEEGIKIYTIGIGKEGGAPIPVPVSNGRRVYAQNPDGSVYKAEFNEEALREIANITKGKFFRVDDQKSFDDALKDIDNLEKTEAKLSTKTNTQDRFTPFLYVLYIFISLFVLGSFLLQRK